MTDRSDELAERPAADEPHMTLSLPVHVIDRVSDTARRLENEVRGRELRRHPRFAVGIATYIQIDGVAGQTSASVGDISLGGLYLRIASSAIQAGTRVRLVLELPFFASHRICTLSGKVVRVVKEDVVDGLTGAGVMFDVDGERPDRELLRDFLELWGRKSDGR